MSNKQSEHRNLGRRLAGVTMPISRKRIQWKRNWKCLCGSEKKYKNCCLKDMDELTIVDNNASVQVLSEDIQKMIDIYREEDKMKGGV